MKFVIRNALSQDKAMKNAISAYGDGVYVNKHVVSSTRVIDHLSQFGLFSKDPKHLTDGAKVFGLAV